MKRIFTKLISTAAGATLSFAILTDAILAQAATYNLSWTGNVGYSMTGMFGFDEESIPTNSIVTENELEFMTLSFFDPDEVLLQDFDYSFPNPDTSGEFNFNFDATTETILQTGFALTPTGVDWGIDNGGGLETGLDFYSCFDPSGECSFSFLGQGIVLQRNDEPAACFDRNNPSCTDLDGGGVIVATRKSVPEPTNIMAVLIAGIVSLLTSKKLAFSMSSVAY